MVGMAKPVCTLCGQYEGALIESNLDDGETQVVCGSCLLMYALSMAAALTTGMTEEQAKAYGGLLDSIRANDPRPATASARGSRRKTPASTPPDEPQATTGNHATSTVALLDPCPECGSKTATGDSRKLACDGCGAVLATNDDAPA